MLLSINVFVQIKSIRTNYFSNISDKQPKITIHPLIYHIALDASDYGVTPVSSLITWDIHATNHTINNMSFANLGPCDIGSLFHFFTRKTLSSNTFTWNSLSYEYDKSHFDCWTSWRGIEFCEIISPVGKFY